MRKFLTAFEDRLIQQGFFPFFSIPLYYNQMYMYVVTFISRMIIHMHMIYKKTPHIYVTSEVWEKYFFFLEIDFIF